MSVHRNVTESRDSTTGKWGLKWTPDEVEQLRDLRARGWTCSDIGKVMGRTKASVSNQLERQGIPPAPVRATPQQTHDPVLREAFAKGAPIKLLARTLGIDEKAVHAAYQQYGAELTATTAPFVPYGGFIGSKEMARIVSPICGVTVAAILSKSRYKPAVLARMAIIRALRDRDMSLCIIMRAIGRGDHSTIHHALERFETYLTVYPQLAEAYAAIKRAEAVAMERRAA